MIRFDASTTGMTIPRIQGAILSSLRLKRFVVGTLAMELLTSIAGLVAATLDLSDLA
jgi:hypothetical protein